MCEHLLPWTDQQRGFISPTTLILGVFHLQVTFTWRHVRGAAGFAVMLVNFRGSLGFGEDSVQSLPGSIGVNDVADCMAALEAAVEAGAQGKGILSVDLQVWYSPLNPNVDPDSDQVWGKYLAQRFKFNKLTQYITARKACKVRSVF